MSHLEPAPAAPRSRPIASIVAVTLVSGIFVVTAAAAPRVHVRSAPGAVAVATSAPDPGGRPSAGAPDSVEAGGAVELAASVLAAARPRASAPARQAGDPFTPIEPVSRRIADPAWVARVTRLTGVPGPAIRAYGTAVLTLQREDPGCHLGWTTLAAIGQMESGHGTGHGAELREDGTTSIPILGPALSGGSDYAAIPASALGTSLHGDPTWEHAVGPMQFIPSTWKRWVADGDGDGIANPHDLDDAAFAAARYLCASGADLGTGPGWQRAVFSYNHSDRYVDAIRDIANRTAAAL